MSDITTDFIKATKKLHADVRAILTTLHVIRDDVKIVREQSVGVSTEQDADQQTENTADTQANRLVSRGHLQNDEARGQTDNPHQESESGPQEFIRRFKQNIRKPKFYVELVALFGLIAYTCETRRTNDLTQQALRFQRDSIAAQVTIEGWDFVGHVIPNQQIGVWTKLNNSGRSPAIYGFSAQAFRWTDLPDTFPLEAPDTNTVLETTVPGSQSIYDIDKASEEFIYNIPRITELRANPATHHLEPPLPRPTLFFVGRLVYDSLGVRTDKEFCFFMIYRTSDVTTPDTIAVKGDNRFVFIGCPKWNQTTTKQIP